MCVFILICSDSERLIYKKLLIYLRCIRHKLLNSAQRLSAGCVLLRSTAVGTVMLPFSCFPCGRSEWKNQRRLPQQPASLGIPLKHSSGHCHGWTPRLRPENQQVMPRNPRQFCERLRELFVCLRGGQSPSYHYWDPNEGGPANGSLAAPS